MVQDNGLMVLKLDDVNQYLTIRSNNGLFLVLIAFDRRR